MAELFANKSPNELLIVGNEGSSRSAKTYDSFHFFTAICDQNRGNPQEIYFIRDTLVNCRDFTLNEFKRCLGTFYDEEGKKCGLGIWDDKNFVGSPKPTYNLFGHKIKFRGIDDMSEAYPSDFLFLNEVLDQNTTAVKDLLMRCRKMAIMDWNPKFTAHDIFDMEKRSDTIFTKSNYKSNRFAPKSFVRQIESYCPWDLSAFGPKGWLVPVDQRKPNLANIAAGTVDLYRWLVYGEGVRANKEGLVFPNVTWVDKFPDDVEYISHGMDFGSAAPTAIVKGGFRKREKKPDLFLQKLHYNPCANSDEVDEVLNILGLGGEDKHLWSDTDFMGKGWIADLRRKGKFIYPTVKYPGSREYWITTLSRFNLHIVKDPDFRKEQENFSYRVVDGKQLSETIKKFDHLWSASGYLAVGDFRELLNNYYGE